MRFQWRNRNAVVRRKLRCWNLRAIIPAECEGRTREGRTIIVAARDFIEPVTIKKDGVVCNRALSAAAVHQRHFQNRHLGTRG